MNPIKISKKPVTTATFDSIMEDAFMPFGGNLRTCGAPPICVQIGRKNTNGTIGNGCRQKKAAYQKCKESVQGINLQNLSTNNTPLTDSTAQTGAPLSINQMPDQSTDNSRVDSGMSTGTKITIGVGVAVGLTLLFVVIAKATKPKGQLVGKTMPIVK